MLTLESIKKTYSQPNGEILRILDIPEYRLESGEEAILVGASGGGKTTLLHVIAGITRPDSGRVLIDEIDLATLREPTRDRVRADKIGYVFQTFNLLPGLSALENVLLGMTFSNRRAGERQPTGSEPTLLWSVRLAARLLLFWRERPSDVARAKGLLERVGLGGRLHHRPRMMSVGEQQRVAVARALANQPKLLLADEPTANVDPANQQQIVDLIRSTCREQHVTLLMVTHATEVAEQFQRVDRLDELNLVVRKAKASA